MGTRLLLKKGTPPNISGNILFVGDSITVGANCIQDGSYCVRTINLMNARTTGIWTGLALAHGGYSTWDGAAVIDSDLSGAGSFAPDYVFLYYGANDGYPLDHLGDYTSLNASDETSWKAAYTYIIEAIRTKYPSAPQYIGKSYRCNSNGDVEGWLPLYIFPWIDDLVAAYPYLHEGINGAEILSAGYPESMGDPPHGVHPACAGHQMLAEGIVSQMFGL